MKRILLLAVTACLAAAALSQIKISELPSLTTAPGAGMVPIVALGTTQSVTVDKLFTDRTLAGMVELSYATLAYGTSVSVNFAGAAFQGITATSTATVLNLTGTGYPTTGTAARSVTLVIAAGTGTLTIGIPAGWEFTGTGTPGSLPGGKLGTLAMTALGTTGVVLGNFSSKP